MILMPGRWSYELPVFDRLDKATLRGPIDGNDTPLELTTASQIKAEHAKEQRITGKILSKPAQYAVEGRTLYFWPAPAKSYIVDVGLWHRVIV